MLFSEQVGLRLDLRCELGQKPLSFVIFFFLKKGNGRQKRPLFFMAPGNPNPMAPDGSPVTAASQASPLLTAFLHPRNRFHRLVQSLEGRQARQIPGCVSRGRNRWCLANEQVSYPNRKGCDLWKEVPVDLSHCKGRQWGGCPEHPRKWIICLFLGGRNGPATQLDCQTMRRCELTKSAVFAKTRLCASLP